MSYTVVEGEVMKVTSKDYVSINSALQRLGVPQRSMLAKYLFNLFLNRGSVKVLKESVENTLGIKFNESKNMPNKSKLSDYQYTELRDLLEQAGLISVSVDPDSQYQSRSIWSPRGSIVTAINKKNTENRVMATEDSVNDVREVVVLLAQKMDLEPPFTKENIKKQLESK